MSQPTPKDPCDHDHTTVILVNAQENPAAVIDEKTFVGNWTWLRTPQSWEPGEPLPTEQEKIDALIIFAGKYREEETETLCRNVRGNSELETIPLLVAVNQYQMPLANRMRKLPQTDFVLTPIEEDSLRTHLARATGTSA